jgi:hypothetical protein
LHKEWQGVIRPQVEEGRIFLLREAAAREERRGEEKREMWMDFF